MKTLLICHDGAHLSQRGMARWLASFSDLAGIIVLCERNERKWRRVRREIKRVGLLRFVDVVAFRIYYRLFLKKRDQAWEECKLEELLRKYPEIPADTPVLHTHSPNTREAEQFVKSHAPDIMIARCKTLIRERVFSVPGKGTFVMHPGIVPEYRNAHGCFWALANDELEKVGMTLLRIDRGVDTGPVYGYYSYDFDEVNESHIVIQNRVVLENLDSLKDKLIEIYNDRATSIDTSDRESAMWGQPWLTKYVIWKLQAREREKQNEGDNPSLS